MFKCTECGCEYEKKPEYCDCGNDEFVLTVEEKELQKQAEPVKPVEPVKTEIKQVEQPKAVEINDRPSIKVPRFQVEPISLSIFILCLILSFLIIFAWNPVVEEKAPIKKEDTPVTNIPSINKLWKEAEIKEEEPVKPAPKPQTVQQPVKKVVKNTATQKVQQKTQPKQTQKNTQTKQTKTTTAKQPVKQTVQQPTQTKPAETKTQTTQPVKQEVKTQTTQTVSTPKVDEKALAEAKLQKTFQEKKEFDTYKINLRNEIGRKINFTRVIGDGDCTIAFKIDSSGKLISRSFEKQSSNMTLNDAVYAAVMATPSFNPPPNGYKGETLRLVISFNNGNFAISLK